MQKPHIRQIDSAVRAVCPINGVSIGKLMDKTTWRVDFSEAATDAQKNAAAEVIAALDLNEPTTNDVNSEAQRRMAAFVFAGKNYDLVGESLINVSGAGTLALAAIINGAQPGDLRWADPDEDFTWIADDNTRTPMDAQTTWAFAQTAAAWRKHHIYKARALKDMSPIPADYTSESYWT